MKPFPIFAALTCVGVVIAHYLVFVFVPMESTMGAVQRIFYFHVPSAWLCYLGFILCFFGSAGFSLSELDQQIDNIKQQLTAEQLYGMCMLCNLEHPDDELAVANLYVHKKVSVIEASAYVMVTKIFFYASLVKIYALT